MKFLKTGLIAVTIVATGLLILPIKEANAAEKCRQEKTVVNGRVVETKTVCTKVKPKPKYRTVCEEYWRRGIKYRECHEVRVR
ncbi:MAG TPA: hypothetical protein DEP36_08570 [Gammaproteobacteria bacterium]|nr:hypothetical protein [Gammaproteobacteria bacterium]HRF45680.1 hypothetical protein [Candidatus Competibacteraceae bacterium]